MDQDGLPIDVPPQQPPVQGVQFQQPQQPLDPQQMMFGLLERIQGVAENLTNQQMQLQAQQQELFRNQQQVQQGVQQQVRDNVLAQQRQFKFAPPKPFSGKEGIRSVYYQVQMFHGIL